MADSHGIKIADDLRNYYKLLVAALSLNNQSGAGVNMWLTA